ncbi:energy-coupling factor transporter transmembrane protein EcfT [Macrococcus hajekii]|uniref:Energy-coupling factor transporter transmembrane protein EcfT n=1 Tax=Macrococcus hajekii TaxID=198482 RepID=A0A4V3BE23_9STAP|nr:energy-coupling factor transporter transmembrane protein EcfT [Macrococcus hajekii]TDM01814.1 energy-coupling factor transporter transmembrane protein EcfT [Macrococcus hajekii]GGB07670.1 energy-coupling factor transporter transmembrane protein EcfT [Macrococcus hajekii]
MLDKMVLGRYVPMDSFVHRLDPRMKLLFVFLMTIIIFFANNVVTYAVLILIVLITLYLAKLKLSFVLGGLKPILLLLIFTLVMHIFWTKGGGTLFSLSFITVDRNGVEQGIFITLRFVLIIFLTTIMTLTTSPISLTDAIETLFRPLKKIRIPVHELALMMSIALRFIPTLMDETQKVMRAQMSRGSDMTTGNVMKRLKALVPLLVPLFVSAFKRAEDLAVAMEVRGYRGDINRTKYRRLNWQMTDTLTLLAIIPIAIIILYFRN